MKRIMSLALVATILISIFTILPFNIFAAEPDPYTKMTFDETGIGSYNFTGYGEVVPDPDTTSNHNNVLKLTKISKKTSSGNDGKWMHIAKITNDDATDAFKIKPGATYKLSYDIKKTKATIAFNVALLQAEPGANLTNTSISSFMSTNHIITESWQSSQTDGGWSSISTPIEFTTKSTSGRTELLLVLTNSSSKVTEQEIYLDNITIELVESVEVTYHNYTPEVSEKIVTHVVGGSYDTPTYEGRIFKGWFLDKELTEPAPEKVTKTAVELWGKWELPYHDDYTQMTFDEDGIGTYTFTNYGEVVPDPDTTTNHGNVLKLTKISKKTTSSTTNDGKWMHVARITNDDATDAFKLLPGATYTLNYEIKKTTADIDFNVALLQATPNTNLNSSSMHNYFSWEDETNHIIAESWQAKQTDGGWAKLESPLEFTAKTTADRTELLLVLETSGSKIDTQEIYLDNVTIKLLSTNEPVEVKYHNYTPEIAEKIVTNYVGKTYDVPTYEGLELKGWFLDEDLTEPAPLKVSKDATELWGKWGTPEPDSIINTFDHDFLHYTESVKSDGETLSTKLTIGDDTDHVKSVGDYGASLVKTEDINEKETTAIKFTKAKAAKNRWPAIFSLYDDDPANLDLKLKQDAVYKVSLKYRVDKSHGYKLWLQLLSANAIGNPFGSTWSNSKYVEQHLLEVSGETDGWQEFSTYVYTNSNHTGNINLSLANVNVSTASSDLEIYVDDIQFTEVFDVVEIEFETNGGNTINNKKCVIGEKIPALPEVSKDGFLFGGWFKDEELTVPFDEVVMPANNIKVYAKWIEAANTAYKFESGFEVDDYNTEVIPYTNKDNKPEDDKNDNVNTENVRWLTDDEGEAFAGKGRLYFDNSSGKYTADSNYLAAALINPDGSYYQVVKGQRYHISYAGRFSGNSANSEYLGFVTYSQAARSGLNSSNIDVLNSISFQGAVDITNYEWFENDGYFIANETEKVFVVAYSPTNGQYIELDNLVIEPIDDTVATTVEFYNEAGQLLTTKIGAIGSEFVSYNGVRKEGFDFAGWYDEDGKQFVANVFPNKDTKLYPKYTEQKPVENPTTDFSKPVVVDFEQDGVKAFYESNWYYSYGPNEGCYAIVGDKEGAYSGDSYYRFKNVGHWTRAYYRKVKFYTDRSADNQVWLEPNTAYRVTYQIKLDSVGATNLYLASFSDEYEDGWTVLAENYMNEASKIKDFGKYVQYETTIVTDDLKTSLGFVVYGGYLTASIDDITITKLVNVNINFETNGGTEIPTITQLSYGTVMQPTDPEKEGYRFKGWFSDKELKNEFDFTNTIITEDITLYAKWEKELPSEPIYEDQVITTQTETTVEITPEDAHLDAQLTINTNDKIKQEKITVNTKNTGVLIWVLIAVVAVTVIAGGVVVFIIVKKRKKA